MAGAIAITRREMTAAELRAASGKGKSARAARRMLAIALVLEGVDRKTAAETCGMDRQTLRDWVHRYNAEGLAGLENRRSSGPPRLLTAEQKALLAARVEAGPDPKGGAVAAHRPEAVDRGRVRGADARAHGGQAAAGARLSPAVGAPAPSEGRRGRPGGL
jgi:transposase